MKPTLRTPEDINQREDWSQCFLLHGNLARTKDVVSIAEHAALSLGNHSSHEMLLLIRRGHELTLHEMFLVCALISFVYDTPVVPDLDSSSCRKLRGAKNLHGQLRKSTWRGLSAYGDALVKSAEICDGLYRPENFLLGRGLNFSAHFPLPSSDKVKRGIRCYWNALLAVPVPARILNFWRAIESVTTPAERNSLPSRLRGCSLSPVFAYKASGSAGRNKSQHRSKLNTTRILRNEALKTLQVLCANCGTDENVMSYLHVWRRGKAAHADVFTLEHDDEGLSEQIRDASFLQCLARVALEGCSS